MVVLPAPFGPEVAEHLAPADLEVKARSASKAPNRFARPSARIAVSMTLIPFLSIYP